MDACYGAGCKYRSSVDFICYRCIRPYLLDEAERMSWHEYYSGCSDLGRFVPTAPLSMGFTVLLSFFFSTFNSLSCVVVVFLIES